MIVACILASAALAFAVPASALRDPGRDPCKMTGNGFGLKCSNITSQFFSSSMFFSLNDDMARFTGEMKRLEILHSNISSLSRSSFKNMPHLAYLVASNVSIKFIDRGAFEGLGNLKMADLSSNEIEDLPVSAFRDTRISYLNLNDNRKLKLPVNGPIIEGKRLRSLTMKKCQIHHLPGSAFVESTGLSYLDLSENLLEMLPRRIFAPLEHLEYIDLSGNQFSTIDFAVFTSVPSYPNLPGSVVLAGNPWLCDCKISGLIRWLTENKNEWTNSVTLSRLQEMTTCRAPDELKGLSWNDSRLKNVTLNCQE